MYGKNKKGSGEKLWSVSRLFYAFIAAIIVFFFSVSSAYAVSILIVQQGGTGWGAPGGIQAHTVVLGNGIGSLSTTSPTSNTGYVLTSNGLGSDPTFQPATGGGSTLITSGLGISTTTSTGGAVQVNNTGLLSLQQTYGTAQTGVITFSTTSASFNGLTVADAITNSGGNFTITPLWSGTLNLSGGGTGTTTFSNTGVIYSDGTKLTQDTPAFNWNDGSQLLDIGTTTPLAALTVQTGITGTNVLELINGKAGGSGNGAGIQAETGITPIAQGDRLGFMLFGFTDGVTNRNAAGFQAFADQAWTPGSVQGSYLTFETTADNAASRTERLRVTSNGNIGVASSTPYGLLSVNANAIGTAPEFVVGSSTGTNLVVANSGFVGVGTSSPAAQFDSEANSNSNMILGVFRNYNAGTSAVTTFNVTNDAGSQFGLQIYSSTNNLTQPSYGGSITLGGYARLRASTAASGLIVGTGGGTPVVFITNDTEVGRFTSGGNLGIGTSSPYAQLSIGGGNLVVGAATAGGSIGDLFLPKLGVAAGSFLAVDPTGKVIATTTPSGSGSGTVGTGLLGQLPYYAANGTTLTATSSIFLAATGAVSNLNGDVFSEQASYVVSTTTQDGNFTSLQSAINALPSTGGLIDVRCGVYTLAATTSIKVANTVIQGEGNCTQFNFDGSVVYTAITPATDNLTGIQLKNFYIHQTNATFQGIGIDASNTPLITVNGIKIDQTATTTRIKDTKNESFYQRWENLDLRNNNSCIDIGGLPVNDNLFENIRCGPIAGGKGFGLFMTSSSVNGAQDNTFTNFDVEPIGAATGITAIYADNAVDDLFINPYVEGNATGWKLTANSQRVNFQGGEFLSNTTYTNAGSNNQWLGVDKEGVAFQLIQASSTIADVSGNDASTPSLSFIGNTNFAKTSNAIKIAFANSTDSGVPLLINNPGTGTTTQLVDTGTGNAFEVDDQTNDLTAFVINAAGQTSIATDTPLGTAVLTTNGGVYLHGLATGAGNGALCATTDGLVSFDSGANCITSTILSKYDIQPITGSQAQEVLDLHPVQYNYYSDGSAHYGFIAEDVAKIDPKLVIYAQEDTTVIGANGTTTVKKGQPLSIDYERYTGLLTAEVQLQEKQMQALKVGTMADYVKKSWYWYLVVVFAIYVVYNEWDKRRRK